MSTCETCGADFTANRGQGRPGRYCSNACRQRAYRHRNASPYPPALTARSTWVRAWDKRPLTVSGAPASSTNPATWATFTDVKTSNAGNGYGIMLGGGLGCYDLDHVTDTQARDYIATITEPIIYAEYSQSGQGVHVFVEAPPAPGWRRTIGGISVERYTRGRFIRTTGKPFQIR